MHIDGGCHCGYIKYEAEIDPNAVRICHCTDCQTLTGSAYRVTVAAPSETFKLTGGKPKIYVKVAESGNKRWHGFCPECGTPVYATAPTETPDSYGIRVGTAHQRAQLAPKAMTWCRSAAPWSMNIEALPKNMMGGR